MSEFCKVEAIGSKNTLIVFSSRDATKFDYEWYSSRLNCNRILVRDPLGHAWYNQGVVGLGETVEQTCAGLAQAVKSAGGDRLLTLGSSMGGYAAILFGGMLHAERALAISPQTLLDPVLPIAPPDEIGITHADLRPFIQSHPETLVQVVSSDDDMADQFHRARIADFPHVETVTVRHVEHWVALELHRAGKMIALLDEWFDHGTVSRFGRQPWLYNAKFATAVIEGAYAFFSGDHETAVRHFSPAALLYRSHAGLHHCFGISLWHLGKYAAAEAAFRRALVVRPGWGHAIHFLALAIVMQGRISEAEPLFRTSLALTAEPWAEAHFWIGFCLGEQGYADAAAVEMWRARRIKPELSDPITWLTQRNLPIDQPI